MDILAEVLDRVRLGGTLLFHFELGHPWNLALPARPYALFHYLSRGSATLALEQGRELHMTEGDFVVVTRGEPHVIYSDRRTKPLPILDLDRLAGRLGVVRHGGSAQPLSTMICGNFTVARPSRGSVLELLPPVLLLKPTEDGGWLEAILQRMVSEAALERPGPRRRTLTTDRSAVRRGVAKLDQVSRSRRRRVAGGDGGPAHRTGASVDPRTTGSALDPWRPRAQRGARSLGVFGSLHQARRPVHVPLSDRTPDVGGCVSARNKRRGDCTDCDPCRLRDRGRVFEAVPSTSWPIAWPLPSSSPL